MSLGVSAYLRLALLVVSVSLITVNSPLRTSFGFAGIGYVVTSTIIPMVTESFVKIGLKGRDMSKPPPSVEIAESIGTVPAVTYLFLMIAMIPFVFFKYLVSFASLSDDKNITLNYTEQYTSVSDNQLFPHNKLAEFLSGILCLQSTTLLGLFDDLFDIRWRHKFFLPAVASLPLLIVYYVDFSVTSVVIPGFVTQKVPYGDCMLNGINGLIKFGNDAVAYITGLQFRTLTVDYQVPTETPKLLDLGVFYYLYMSAVSIFSPNSINILAGVNGLEVGQSIVLAVIFLINDFCYLFADSVSQAAHDSHLLSSIFIVPFVGVSLGLLQYNWFPATVFVGDTYCYFSGMIFAIVGILGHFSKTLLIFLLPQVLNFVYSMPQLFAIVPCPRHRLPSFNVSDGLMYNSFAAYPKKRKIVTAALSIAGSLGLVKLKRDERGHITHFSNLTLINLVIVWFGPMREDKLCLTILSLQFALGVSMIVVRHTVGPWIFGYDNLSWAVQ